MAVAVSEAAASAIAAAIREGNVQQLATYQTFIAYLDLNFGQAAAQIPGSPAMAQRVLAQNSTDILIVLSNMLKQQQSLVAEVQVIQTALAGISSQVAAGVTTAQVAASDQIKANQFHQQTTNASLKRADLPETEVTDESFLESTKKLVDDTISFKSQIFSSTLISDQLTSAVSWTATSLGNYVSASYVGKAVQDSQIFQRIKGFFVKAKEPKEELVKTSITAQADLRAKALLDPTPKLHSGQWD
jgi:hypothetical protein